MSPRNLGTRPLEADMLGVRRAAGIGRWVDWTPTVTQTGAVTVTVTQAKYCRVGKTCHVYAYLTVTGSGSANAYIYVAGLPAAATPSIVDYALVGTGSVWDNSATDRHTGGLRYVASTGFHIVLGGSATTADAVGTNPAFDLAANDLIQLCATYPVA